MVVWIHMITNREFKRILLSRTDNIGDVIFTLPMAGWIKRYYPKAQVFFLGKAYTKPIVDCAQFIDGFYDWDTISKTEHPHLFLKDLNLDAIVHVFPNAEISKCAKQAGIPFRIGTNRRFFHWFDCNKRVNLSRKHSDLHESQLNIKLLEPLLIPTDVSVAEIPDYYGFSKIPPLLPETEYFLDKHKINVILHPKSKGSAKEWLAENFVRLSRILPADRFHFIACGVPQEEQEIQSKILSQAPHIQNAVGKLTLEQYIALIQACDALVAASTGPLHIAAALEKHAIGLYPTEASINPKRWGPLGKKAVSFVGNGDYMEGIDPKTIAKHLDQLWKFNTSASPPMTKPSS